MIEFRTGVIANEEQGQEDATIPVVSRPLKGTDWKPPPKKDAGEVCGANGKQVQKTKKGNRFSETKNPNGQSSRKRSGGKGKTE